MKEKIIKYLPLIANIVSLTVLATIIIYGQTTWVAPTAAPGQANAPAPINTLEFGQSKIGGLLLNTGGAPTGLTVASGKVDIAGGGLSVFGNITGGGTIKASTLCLGNNCINNWPVICSVSYTTWSYCSRSCGGTQTRIRTNADCSKTTETRPCNTQPCPPCTLQCAGGSSCPWDFSQNRRSCCNVSRQVSYGGSCDQNTGSYTAVGCHSTRVYCY